MPLSLTEVVVDTNVFINANASNDNEEHYSGSCCFLEELQNSSTSICVDGPDADDEDAEYDDIYGTIQKEYRTEIGVGSYGHTVLLLLYNNNRVIKKDRKIGRKEKKL